MKEELSILEKKLLIEEEYAKEKEFWTEQSEYFDNTTSLNTDLNLSNNVSYKNKKVQIHNQLVDKLLKFSRKSDVALYIFLLTSLKVLANKRGNEVVNTLSPLLKKMISKRTFNDAVIIPSKVEEGTSFKDFLVNVKSIVQNCYKNQDFPVEEIIEIIGKNSVTDITSIGCALDGIHDVDVLKNYELPFLFFFSKGESSIDLEIIYSDNNEKMISSIVTQYLYILEQVVNNPNVLIEDIEITNEEEKKKILNDFNNTKAQYPKDKTVKELFEEAAEKMGEKSAVVSQGIDLSYKELNERANKIANTLRKKGVKADSIVGILCDRSIETIIGILGIVKAGGVYLPIDEEYPETRVKYMLKDSESKLIIGKKDRLTKLDLDDIEIELLDIEDKEVLEESTANPDNINTAEDLIYIIYTSGSTGKPKGVCIQQRNVVRLVKNQNFVDLKDGDRIIQTGSIAFDASTFEIWGAILNGLTVHVESKDLILSPAKIKEYINKNDITIMFITTALFHQICNSDLSAFDNLNTLLVGGEVLDTNILNKFKGHNHWTKISNIYGPTENTTYSTSYLIKESVWDEERSMPIGIPIANSTTYVMDKNSKLLPVGVAGELCVGGDGVARGYLNRHELTKEKFVENPYVKGEKIYRTGDLVRWLPDGNIEFLGRIDHQVKIRGFRIELGEIEKYILKCKKVKETIVVVKNDETGNKYLCGYIVGDKNISIDKLKESLGEELPNYMIPTYIIQLDSMPLNQNRKIDKDVLPEPDISNLQKEYVAPRNEVEEKIAEIWGEVLGIDKVGIDDNFFELGGHSLKAVKITSKINDRLLIKFQISDLFKNQTIRKIAASLEDNQNSEHTEIDVLEKREYYDTSSVQKRMFAINQLDSQSTNYNIPFILETKGIFNKEKVEDVFLKLINRHEVLRTSFHVIEGQVVQKIHKNIQFKVEYNKLDILLSENKERIDEEIIEFIRPFALDKAPLIRAKIIELREKNILIIDMHHIISDGVSMSIFISDFKKLYEDEELKDIKVQYKDFSSWQNKLFETNVMEEKERYWLERFKGEISPVNMPTDYERPKEQTYEGDNLLFKIDEDMTGKINNILKDTKTTKYIFLLATFNILLHKYTAQEDIIVGTPVAGRTHVQLEDIIGMFVNTLPMKNSVSGEKTFLEFLEKIKENSFKAFENQDYPLELIIDKLNIQRVKNRNPLFDIMFSVQNIDVEQFEIEGLELTQYDLYRNLSKFDITLNAYEDINNIYFDIIYSTKLYKKDTIERLKEHFIKIIDMVTKNPKLKIEDIDIITEEEKELIDKYNNTKNIYPKDNTVHKLFEEQVEKTPNNIAVVYEDEKLTYKELNERANSLARILISKGVKSDDIVGIMVERSLEMMIGILGILKAGGAYLPIDPEYPLGRTEYILKDSGTKTLITRCDLLNNISFSGQIIDINDKDLDKGSKLDLENIGKSDNLAYVIYTSGSTGKPKGVMVEHHNLINLVWGMKEKIYKNHSKTLNIAQISPYVFDASVKQIFPALLLGHTLCIMPESARRNGQVIVEYYEKYRINISDGTPAHLFMISQALQDFNGKLEIEEFVIGGEKLPINVCRELYDVLDSKDIKINNVYGPTECTDVTTTYSITYENLKKLSDIPIGKPISNVKVYILDQKDKQVPLGIIGELCIGGDGVSRGYLGKTELTNQKFTKNPFKKGEKLYRTGDLARLHTNGNIEFMGRKDNQIKIRGFRIELGEIENCLLKYDRVKEAVVMLKEDNSKESALCAYVVLEKGISIKDVKEYLRKELPNYMIPTYMIQLEKMPLTENGKIDRKVLPTPDKTDFMKEYEEPTNEIEKKMADIWSEILGVEKVGITDNFFELGGHSLKAVNLISKMQKELNIKIKISDIFDKSTIKELALTMDEIAVGVEQYEEIGILDRKEYYGTSSVQKRMYALNQKDENSLNYNMPLIFIVDNQIKNDKLELAFKKLIDRHETLRTSFEIIDDEIIQKIHEEVTFKLESIKMDGELYSNKDMVDKTIKEFIRPFNLTKAPLLRSKIIELTDKKIFMIDMHHIISDGVSLRILISELKSIYEGIPLDEVKVQYKEFADWQNKLYENGTIAKQEEYWMESFKGEIPVLNMPTDYNRPSVQSSEGAHLNFEFGKELTKEINSAIKRTGTTKYMFLLAVFNVVLSKYSGQEDIVIGTPIAGRTHASLENTVGMFVNTLALRNKPQSNKIFQEFLSEVKENSINAFENQNYRLETLIEKLGVKRDTSRNPLFDVMFTLNNQESSNSYMVDESSERLDLADYGMQHNISKFDITLFLVDEEEEITGSFEYNTKLYKKETINKFIVSYKNILKEVANNLEKTIKDIEIIDEEEKKKVLYEFNNTEIEYPKNSTIHQLFEEQVEKTPDNIALVYKDQRLTYRELNERANSVANILISKGLKVDDIVGIMLDTSIEMIIGILGILKAGGAYLPIDPQYPKSRIEYMVKDSHIKILLIQSHLKDKVDFDGEIINLDEEQLYKENITNPNIEKLSKDLAYVIYTSGSTGEPKGVLVEHKSLVNLCYWHNNEFGVKQDDRSIKYAGFGFDASVWEIFPYIIKGAQIHIISEDIKLDVDGLNKYFEKNNITIGFLPTQMCEQFMDIENKSLRKLLTGGDKLNKYTKRNYDLVNNYGPTECTVVTTCFTIDKEYDNLPIGKPISNAKVYILDKNNNMLPVGVAGELCIGGDCLARGYLNKSDLTDEVFIKNPFIEGEKIYKTGDLVRWLPSGNIEFLGRIDNQVQIRGFRVEVGEIEKHLLSHDDVKEAVVVPQEGKNNDKYLCGYVVGEEYISFQELKEYLGKKLPNYMVPTHMIQLEEMPLNKNGKIDRKELPIPDLADLQIEYIAPRNELEEKIAEVWGEVLGVEKVGINDNFFDLGGHSLKAVNVISKIQKELDIKLQVSDIFEKNTIKGLAELLNDADTQEYEEIKTLEDKEYYETSSVQKRMYAIYEKDKESKNYNVPGTFIIDKNVDKDKLEEALIKIINRHESLRTSFKVVDGQIMQKINEEVEFKLEHTRIDGSIQDSKELIDETISEFVRPFDLEKAPLIRSGIIELKDKQMLMIDIHHIIADGVSFGIIMNELSAIYEGESLSEVKVQYKEFAYWQNKLYKTGVIKKQEEYWLDKFKGELPVLNMHTDYIRPPIKSFEGNNIKFEVGEELTKKINEVIKTTETTKYMFLMAAFNILLSKYTSQEDIIIGTPTAGRTHASLENIVGMFVNTLPLRNYVQSDKTVKGFLNKVKENFIKAFENQDYQLEVLIDKLGIPKDISRNPLFDVLFTLQNFDISEDTGNLTNPGLNFEGYGVNHNISKFDITLSIIDDSDKITGMFQYSTKLFKRDTIERLKNHYKNILEEIVNNIDIAIQDIEIIDEEDKAKILYDFNNTIAEYPRDKTVKELFEEVVEKSGDKLALVAQEEKLSYKELNERANKVASVLREKGVKADSIVGILCDRSVDSIIGILGIVKAGGAYLPIDKEYTENRIKYMIKDSKSKLIIGKEEQLSKLNIEDTEVELINIEGEEVLKASTRNIEDMNSPEDLIYVIYTSGSTGKPKGVCVEHRGIVRLVKNNNYMEFKEDSRLLKNLSMSFDPSAKEIWGSLLNKMVLYLSEKEETINIHKLEQAIQKNKIDVLVIPAPLFNNVALENPQCFEFLECVMVGGDVINTKAAKKIKENYPKLKLINAYGPTENSVTSTTYLVDEVHEDVSIPIGKPILNSTAYIMDKNSKLLPIGVVGELCVGGDGVARGYLNREELTKEKFIYNPHKKDERIYKTGDLGRWLPDGNIEFLGRIDHQIKIRGYRIEVGEIEKNLLNHKDVKEAVVVVRYGDNNNKYLCAFVIGEGKISINELKEYLEEELPSYMIPTHILQIDSMPLTQNGKIDREALPVIEMTDLNVQYVAPRNETEEKLAEIWSEVLGIEKVGVKESFFDIGGDSIKSIQIVSRLRKYGLSLQVKDILHYKTIDRIAKQVTKMERLINQEPVDGSAGLTPIMKQFLQTDKEAFNYFNQSMMIHSDEGFEEKKLREVMEKIVEHHDALRMVLQKGEDINIYNRQINDKLYELITYDLKETQDYEKEVEKMATSIQESIDVEEGPLVKMGLFKTDKGDELLIVIHHLVIDGVSWRIILEDFLKGYNALKEGKDMVLPYKTMSFKEWTENQYKYANSKKVLEELKYWEGVINQNIEKLPKNNNTKVTKLKDMELKELKLDENVTQKLLKETNKAYNTEINDILLSSLGMAVKEWAGVNKLAVNLEGHGREEIYKGVDITRTVGWFTSCYPIVLDISDKKIGNTIKKTKENLRRVPNKGIGYGILKYLTDKEYKQGINLDINTEISFNYLGQFDQDIDKGFFTYSNLSKGSSCSPELQTVSSIEINSAIRNGRLSLVIGFNKEMYNRETIEKFMYIYEKNLNEVINHCSTKEETEYTATDFGINEYTMNELEELNRYVDKEIGQTVTIEKINKLTSMQEEILSTYLHNNKTNAYIVQLEMEIDEELDLDAINQAYNGLVERHEILRTIFYNHQKHPSQIVLNKRNVKVNYEDYSSERDKEDMCELYKKEKIEKGFDISKDLMYRISIIKIAERKYRMVITSHHIILDGWSNSIIMKEFFTAYELIKSRKEISFEKTNEYSNYLSWIFEQPDEGGIEYWSEYIKGYKNDLGIFNNSKDIKDYEEGVLNSSLDSELTFKLRELSRKNGVTLNTICQTAWGLALHKYSNINDVVFGAVVSGRPTQVDGIENMVGIFINIVPVRVKINNNTSMKEVIKELQNKNIAGKKYEHISVNKVLDVNRLEDKTISSLMFFQNYPISKATSEAKEGLTLRYRGGREQTSYNLNVVFSVEDKLKIKLMYNKSLYKNKFMNTFIQQLEDIFKSMIDNEELF